MSLILSKDIFGNFGLNNFIHPLKFTSWFKFIGKMAHKSDDSSEKICSFKFAGTCTVFLCNKINFYFIKEGWVLKGGKRYFSPVNVNGVQMQLEHINSSAMTSMTLYVH